MGNEFLSNGGGINHGFVSCISFLALVPCEPTKPGCQATMSALLNIDINRFRLHGKKKSGVKMSTDLSFTWKFGETSTLFNSVFETNVPNTFCYAPLS